MNLSFTGKNIKYYIGVIILFVVLYIVWIIMTHSGIFYYTKDINNLNVKSLEIKMDLKLPQGIKIIRAIKVLGVSNIYVKISIPNEKINELLLNINSNKKLELDGNGVTYGKFTSWCGYDKKNIEYTYVKEEYRGKGTDIHSIIIILKPENQFRTVYIFNGRLQW